MTDLPTETCQPIPDRIPQPEICCFTLEKETQVPVLINFIQIVYLILVAVAVVRMLVTNDYLIEICLATEALSHDGEFFVTVKRPISRMV